MSDHYKEAYKRFYPDLLKSLPITDLLFCKDLEKNNLFFGNLSDEVKTKDTEAEKTEYFLQNAIDHSLKNDNTEPFASLLEVMKNFDNEDCKSLAKEIKEFLSKEQSLDPEIIATVQEPHSNMSDISTIADEYDICKLPLGLNLKLDKAKILKSADFAKVRPHLTNCSVKSTGSQQDACNMMHNVTLEWNMHQDVVKEVDNYYWYCSCNDYKAGPTKINISKCKRNECLSMQYSFNLLVGTCINHCKCQVYAKPLEGVMSPKHRPNSCSFSIGPSDVKKPGIDDYQANLIFCIARIFAPTWKVLSGALSTPSHVTNDIYAREKNPVLICEELVKHWFETTSGANVHVFLELLNQPYLKDDLKQEITLLQATVNGKPVSYPDFFPRPIAKAYTRMIVKVIKILKTFPNAHEDEDILLHLQCYPNKIKVNNELFINTKDASEIVDILINKGMLSPINVSKLLFLVKSIECRDAEKEIESYESSIEDKPIADELMWCLGQCQSPDRCYLYARLIEDPKIVTYRDLKMSKYADISVHNIVEERIGQGSTFIFWKILEEDASKLQLSKVVPLSLKQLLCDANIIESGFCYKEKQKSLVVKKLAINDVPLAPPNFSEPVIKTTESQSIQVIFKVPSSEKCYCDLVIKGVSVDLVYNSSRFMKYHVTDDDITKINNTYKFILQLDSFYFWNTIIISISVNNSIGESPYSDNQTIKGAINSDIGAGSYQLIYKTITNISVYFHWQLSYLLTNLLESGFITGSKYSLMFLNGTVLNSHVMGNITFTLNGLDSGQWYLICVSLSTTDNSSWPPESSCLSFQTKQVTTDLPDIIERMESRDSSVILAEILMSDKAKKSKPIELYLNRLFIEKYATQWRNIGLELNVTSAALDNINANNPHEVEARCRAMLKAWLQKDPEASWEKLHTVEATDKHYHNATIKKAIEKAQKQLHAYYANKQFKKPEHDWPYENMYTKSSTAMNAANISEEQEHGSIKTEDINSLFDTYRGCGSYKILIEGGPGIGKTILLSKIAAQWANNALLKDKALLLLLFMRQPETKSISNVKPLVEHFFHDDISLVNEITEWLIDSNGKHLTILLDGYDEASTYSLFFDFVNKLILCKTLPKCGLVITSRPAESLHLHDHVNCRAEILEQSRQQFMKLCIEKQEKQKQIYHTNKQDIIEYNIKKKIEIIQKVLKHNPIINTLCYIPLNATMLLLCLNQSEEENDLPTTTTSLYERFIIITMKHFLRTKKKFDSFKDSNKEYYQIFCQLSKFAYSATIDIDKEKSMQPVFELANIEGNCKSFVSHGNGLDLLKLASFLDMGVQNKCSSYNFLHKSIQEYMAAYHIAVSLPTGTLPKLLNKKFWDSSYFNVWVMYIGITGGEQKEFMQFLSGKSRSSKISQGILNDKINCLYLLRCASEAKESKILSSVKNIFEQKVIDLSNKTLSEIDIKTFAILLLDLTDGPWTLNLSRCNINNKCCKVLFEVFSSQAVTAIIQIVNISFNNICLENLLRLCQKIFKSWKTEELILPIDALSNSVTIKSIENFADRLKLLIQTYLGSLGKLMTLYPASQARIIVVYSDLNYVKCFQLYNCELNDFTAKRLKKLVTEELKSYRVGRIYFSYSIHGFETSYFVKNFQRIKFCGLNMHSKGAYLLSDISKFNFQIKSDPSACLIDFLSAVLHNNSQVSTSSAYLSMLSEKIKEETNQNLKNISIIKVLDLTNNQLSDCLVDDIELILSCNKLEEIYLGGNNLHDTGMVKVTEALQSNSILKVFDISNNKVSDKATNSIAVVLVNKTKLEKLHLNGNKLQSEGIIESVNTLYNTSLKIFNVSYNMSESTAASKIAHILALNTQLEELHLRRNNLQAKGISEISLGLARTTTLNVLDISNNDISSEAADDITCIISKQAKLEKLTLGGNNLQDRLIAIIKEIKCYLALKLLDISNNNASATTIDKIAVVFCFQTRLEKLYLGGNNSVNVKTLQVLQYFLTQTAFDFPCTNTSDENIPSIVSRHVVHMLILFLAQHADIPTIASEYDICKLSLSTARLNLKCDKSKILKSAGYKFRVVILSVVRTHHSNNKDSVHKCGFYTDKRILNTAFTRVQSLIVTAAHPFSLITRGHISCKLFWTSYLSQSLNDEECDQLIKEFISKCQVGKIAGHWQLSPEDYELYSILIKDQTNPIDVFDGKGYYDQILNDLEKQFAADTKEHQTSHGAPDTLDNKIYFGQIINELEKAKDFGLHQSNNSVSRKGKATSTDSHRIYEPNYGKSRRAFVSGIHSPYIKLPPGHNRQLFTITVIQGAESGYALTLDPKERDIWLPDSSALNRSLRGDTVVIELLGTRNNKGTVVANISGIDYNHPKQYFVCHADRHTYNLLVPINKQYPKPDSLQKVELNGLSIFADHLHNSIACNIKFEDVGENVYLVRLDLPWTEGHIYPKGVPVKHFKLEGDITTFLNILKFNYIPAMTINNGKFLPHILNEVMQQFPVNWEIPHKERRKRKIHKGAFTIDDKETVVLDDALSLEYDQDKNYVVNVHIADASYFVTPGSALDRAASERGRTFYINYTLYEDDDAFFMLPDNICMEHGSLQAGKEKLAVTIQFVFSKDDYSLLSQLSNVNVHKSIVCSVCQLTKEDVGKYLLENSLEQPVNMSTSRFSKIKKDLSILGKTAAKLRQSQWPDSYLYEPDRGKQYSMAGSSLVEMFMCLCNTAIPAKLLKQDKQVGPVLVHEPIKHYKQHEWLERHHHLLKYCPIFKRMISDEAITSFNAEHLPSTNVVAQADDLTENIIQDNQHAIAELEPGEFLKASKESWNNICALAEKHDSSGLATFLCSLRYFPELYVAYRQLCMSQSRSFYFMIDASSTTQLSKFHHSHSDKIYTHFTSPLRRYCDILVHRAVLGGKSSLPRMHKMNIHKWDEREFSKQRNMLYIIDCCRKKTEAIAITAYVSKITNKMMELYALPELQEVLPDRICELKLSHLQTKWGAENMYLLKWNVEIIPAPDNRSSRKERNTEENYDLVKIPLNTLGAVIEAMHKEKFKEAKKMIKTCKKECLKCTDVEQEVKPSCHKFTITQHIREYSKLDIQLASSQTKFYATEPTVSLVHISQTFSCCLLHIKSPIQCFALNISKFNVLWSLTAHNMSTYVESWQQAIEAESVTNSTSSSRVPLIIKDLRLKWVSPREAQFSDSIDYRIKYQRPFDFGNYVCIQYRDLLSNPQSKYFKLDQTKKVTWVAHGSIVSRYGKDVKIAFPKNTTLPETPLNDKLCYLEVIPLQISFRRIKEMFDQINKIDGICADYSLLEKICCRDYNDPIEVPDDIEGEEHEQLNVGQRRAIETALTADNKLLLVQGPPGTGKSMLCVEMIKRFVDQNYERTPSRGPTILYCAPSNKAVNVGACGIWVVYLINEGVGPKLNFTGIHVVTISTTNLTFYIPVYNYYNEKQLLAWEYCNIRRSGCIDSLVFLEVGRSCQAEAGMLWVYYPTHLAAQFRKSLHRFLHDNAKEYTVPVQVESIFVNTSLNSTYQSRQQLQLTSCTNQDLLQETNLNDSNEDSLANYHEVQDNYKHVGFHERTAVMSSTVADKYKIMCSKSNNESIVTSPCLDQKTCITNTTNASSTEDNNLDKPVPLPPKSFQSRKLCTKKGTSTSSVTSVYQHSGEHSESLCLIEKRKFVQHSQPPIQPIRTNASQKKKSKMENTAFQACSTCSTILTEKLDVKTSNCISLQSKLTSLFVKRSKPQRFGIIYQVLNSHHLLTQKDQQFLINQMYKDHDKIIYLLSWLPRKEDGQCDKFIQSLHQISVNTGHGNIANALLHKFKEFENQNANSSPFVSILIPVYPTTNSARNYYMDGTITVELKKCFNVNIFKEIAIGLFDEYCLPKLGNSFYSTRQSRANSQSCRSVYAVSIETDNKKYLSAYGQLLSQQPNSRNYCFMLLSEKQFNIMDNTNLSKDYYSDDKIVTPPQVVNNSFQPYQDNLHVFAETNSDTNVITCVNDLSESMSFRVGTCYVESESCNSLYTCSSSNTLVFIRSNGSVMEPITSTAQELLFTDNSESLSLNVMGHSRYSPSHTIPTISCSGISVDETIFQESVLCQRSKKTARGYGDGSSSSSDDDNNNEDKRGIHTSFASHYHSSNPQHSLPNSPRYKSLSAAVNTSLTPQTSAGTSHVGLKHEGKMREAAAKPNSTVMGFMLPKSPAVYTSKGDYLIGDSYSLAERGPILLDVPNGRNELVMAAYSTQSIPKLYPIVGLRKELPGIALPPPIPLDLPKINFSRKVTSIISHNQVVREQPMKAGSGLGAVQGRDHDSNVLKQQPMASTHNQQQQQATLSQSMDFSDPVGIISRAAVFLTAGDYGTMIRLLEILDKHLVLPEDIDLAKEFGQGLAHYKNLHYRAAKPCFNALFEKSINYGSSGNQALASIYLGEIEMSWAKYKDAEKHFTLAVTYYSSDNVAEKFQQTILTKSAVLVKKGQCHRSLSQIKEAISAFKMGKEIAELAQGQTRGSKLKTAKEDELSALCALGNILQSIGDYEQSFEYYEKSLKLAGELGDHVSVGWAHGNLGNAMLGLDQKDKALDHLIAAFHMSARYEGNPLAVGRAVSNLGNAYQAIGNLPKAKEYYEIALGHAIYGNDLQGQGRACGNIGNIYMLLKEPVKAVHYYTETLRLSTDKNTKITGYHNRGCATFDVAECILQSKKPKELVTATTPDSAYGTLTIKLTDEVITTDPVQETKPNREPSAQSVSEQRETSLAIETLPLKAYRINEFDDQVTNVRLAEARPFLEAAKKDLLQAIESHEQSVQNVKGSHDALSLSLSLFESNSRSFYKMQETLVELGKLLQQLSELDMVAAEPQEFKEALVYGEQARARTLGELVLQKKKTMYSDLFSIFTPLKIQDIYKTVELQKVPVVFISYCVTKLLIWILVPVKDEVIMKCQSIDLKEEELDNSSFELYIRYNLLQFLSKDEIYIFRRCSYEQESPFTVLHDVIGVKIIEGLKSVGFSEVTEFIVIPDSVTHLLPFCPLMNKDSWQFFGDKYRIRIVPSFLSLLVMSMTSNPVVEVPGDKSDFLIVGNPTIPPFMYDSTQWNLGRLPYAEKEAISVANIIGTVPVLREQATKQSVLYRLRSAKVIHLATHGSASAMFLAFTSSFPVSKSGLAEKEHILIFPKEIETLNISPALVVLSSCDSARGQVKAEGVIGMARAFLSAGAHSVLVSLWRVPDESANIFMQFFYQFLVNGLPSLEALQRSMQCLRCFLKYSHYVHWSGFQIIGKEVTFHKDPHAHFPIQKMLGEVSIFPRQQHVKSIEESLLGVKIKIFTDVQLLVGTPGNEPEECARDFIKNCYYYYPCGVYWYDASDELLLETNMKVAHETPLVGGVYKEQKELDVYPTITNPSLLTTKNSKPTSRKDKKLIVLNNFTNLEKYSYIMREMKDASTDIIVVSNELFCKDEIAKDFDKYFSRGCNIIEVTSLEPISIMQRIVYALLEKNSFVARDADHIVFTLLSEYSRGAATIVHLLTSLMQKNEDNSRTGFELVKRQLKLHIAHQKLERFLNSYDIEDALSSDFNENSATERESHKAHESAMPRGLDHPGKSLIPEVMSYNKKHADVSGSEMHETSCSDHESPKVTDNDASLYIKNEACLIMPDAHSIECGSMQTIAKDSEVTHGDEVIGIALEALKPSTSEQGNIQMIAKDSEIAHGDDVIGITLEALRPLTSERSSTQTIAKDSEIVHGDDILKAPKPLSTGKHSSTQTKVKGSGIGHGGDVISITQEAYQLPSQTGELSSVQTEIDDSEIAHDDDVIGITTEAYRIPSSTSKHSSTQTKVKGSKNDKQTTTSDTTQPLATAKLGKSNVTAVQRHPLYMYINNILSTTSNISLPAHHLLNCLTITGPIPLPLFYVEALDNIVLNAVFSKEKKRIQAESPLKQLMKEGVIRNSCYPILYHRDLDSGSINSSIKPMFIPSLICNAVKDEMDDTDKALSILSAQSALKSLLTNEPKPSVTHLHYLLIVCNQLHDVCSQELHEFNQLLTDNLNLKLHISLTLSSKHDYRANLSS